MFRLSNKLKSNLNRQKTHKFTQMSSIITTKPNPFQRSNPFQVQSTYQPHLTQSFVSFPSKPHTYRPYQPQVFPQKQNLKKPENEVWKFREDNCGKSKVFSSYGNSILNEKYVQEKNSFERELVLSSVGKRHNNGSGKEVERERPIENPFSRKYLMSGNVLAESQVYAGFKGGITGQQNLPTYERFKTQHDHYPSTQPSYTYNYPSYTPIQDNYINLQTNIPSSTNLQTSLHHKNSQFASRKSIERGDSYNRGSYNNLNNGVESRYELDKERDQSGYGINHNHKYGSLASNKELNPQLPSMKDKNFSGNSIPYAERDKQSHSRMYSRVSQKDERINFQNSDQEGSRNQSKEKHREPTFGSKKDIPQLSGPQSITVNGIKFYRQRLQCY